MRLFPMVGIAALLLTLGVVAGCDHKHGTSRSTDKLSGKDEGDDDHDHGPGPHGGTIVELGKWHGEFTVDAKTQEATVYILGSNAKTPAPIAVEKLLLSIKQPQFQLDLKAAPQTADPAGKSSRFVGKHENFAKEQDFDGTLSGVVDGKPYAGDFVHKVQAPGKK